MSANASKVIAALFLVTGFVVAVPLAALWWATYDAPTSIGPRSGAWFIQSYEGWVTFYQFSQQFGDHRETFAVHYWHLIALGFAPFVLIVVVMALRQRPRALARPPTAEKGDKGDIQN